MKPTARTIRDLIGLPTFFVAHRGSGDNWPEHTLTAYTNALAVGAAAVEISVCATSDGVLVCHHDLSARRTLGIDALISELTWTELQNARVDARKWLGEQTQLEPVSRLEDVLSALGTESLAFIEDKQGTNSKQLLDLLDAQPRSTERFVWKQWAPASQVRAAKERGYAAWGYFDEEQMGALDDFAATFDLLGVPVGMDEGSIAKVVRSGPPVMVWEVRYHDDVNRMRGLGVAGLMCANIPYLTRENAETADTFGSGRRAAGDLPSQLETLGWDAQPAFVPARGALRVQRGGDASYLMGSLAQPGLAVTELEFSVCWPDGLPKAGSVGASFGLSRDAPGGDGGRGIADGYEVHIRFDGAVELRERRGGVTGSVIDSGSIAPALRPGQQVQLRVEVDASVARVLDATGAVLAASPISLKLGPWVRLFKSYEDATAVEFSAVRASLG